LTNGGGGGAGGAGGSPLSSLTRAVSATTCPSSVAMRLLRQHQRDQRLTVQLFERAAVELHMLSLHHAGQVAQTV
jgi:hypothetical protein